MCQLTPVSPTVHNVCLQCNMLLPKYRSGNQLSSNFHDFFEVVTSEAVSSLTVTCFFGVSVSFTIFVKFVRNAVGVPWWSLNIADSIDTMGKTNVFMWALLWSSWANIKAPQKKSRQFKFDLLYINFSFLFSALNWRRRRESSLFNIYLDLELDLSFVMVMPTSCSCSRDQLDSESNSVKQCRGEVAATSH